MVLKAGYLQVDFSDEEVTDLGKALSFSNLKKSEVRNGGNSVAKNLV